MDRIDGTVGSLASSTVLCPPGRQILARYACQRQCLPATNQPGSALVQRPMTDHLGRPNSSRPSWPRRDRQVVIGGRSPIGPRRSVPRLEKPEICEFFEHRSAPLPLLRRASERNAADYLRPPTPTRLPPSRFILMSVGNTDPIEATGPALPSVILPIGSLSVVERLFGIEGRKSKWRIRSAPKGVKRISYPRGKTINILPGRIGDSYDGPP